MSNFTPITRLPVDAILNELEAHPDLWDQINFRRTVPGTPHAGMEDIWLRANDLRKFGPEGRPMSEFCDPHVPVWYPCARKLTLAVRACREINRIVEGDMLGGVLLTKMKPGSRLQPHIDRGWHPEYFDKFYLPITSAPGCDFLCQPEGEEVERYCPEAGQVFHFDNNKLHWVENNSDIDRIMMIVCIRTDFYRDLHEPIVFR